MKIKLPENYKSIANYSDCYVLAFNVVKEVPEPWVVWNIGMDYAPHTGRYYKTKEAAKNKFCSLCFDWFEEVKI